MDTTEDPVALKRCILDLCLDGWKFTRVFARVLQKLEAGEANRHLSQLRYQLKGIESRLSEIGLKFVDMEGHPYDPGMAATPLNLADFCPEDILVVDQMIEPIVMGLDGVVKTGTVVLRRM